MKTKNSALWVKKEWDFINIFQKVGWRPLQNECLHESKPKFQETKEMKTYSSSWPGVRGGWRVYVGPGLKGKFLMILFLEVHVKEWQVHSRAMDCHVGPNLVLTDEVGLGSVLHPVILALFGDLASCHAFLDHITTCASASTTHASALNNFWRASISAPLNSSLSFGHSYFFFSMEIAWCRQSTLTLIEI